MRTESGLALESFGAGVFGLAGRSQEGSDRKLRKAGKGHGVGDLSALFGSGLRCGALNREQAGANDSNEGRVERHTANEPVREWKSPA